MNHAKKPASRSFRICCLIGLIVGLWGFSAEWSNGAIIGDMNLDNLLDSTDLLLLGQYLAGGNTLPPEVIADLNEDNEENAADLVWLNNRISGNIVLEAGDLFAVDGVVNELIFIPGGTLMQGSPTGEPCRFSNEAQFAHTLTHDLAVMRTEVTRTMWNDLRVLQPSLPADPTNLTYSSGSDNPVQWVTWYETVLFANLLSVEQGLQRCYYTDASFTTPITSANYLTDLVYCDFNADGYRLPFEGEWEYFCRAGTTTPFWIPEPHYTTSNCNTFSQPGWYPALESVDWFYANSSSFYTTSPVALKPANPWNLCDLHGNVSEYCWDWHGAYPTVSSTDYTGPSSGVQKVARGGTWCNGAKYCRSAYRQADGPSSRSACVGFRLVRVLQ